MMRENGDRGWRGEEGSGSAKSHYLLFIYTYVATRINRMGKRNSIATMHTVLTKKQFRAHFLPFTPNLGSKCKMCSEDFKKLHLLQFHRGIGRICLCKKKKKT